jgi:hypothetical protein
MATVRGSEAVKRLTDLLRGRGFELLAAGIRRAVRGRACVARAVRGDEMSKRIRGSGVVAMVAAVIGCGGQAPPGTTQTSARELHAPGTRPGRQHETGSKLPACPGTRTRHLWFTGNVQVAAGRSWPAWDPTQPRTSAVWSTATELRTADGYTVSVLFYFVPEGDGVAYHALLADSVLELASGRLRFDEAGALESVEQTRPLRLWGARGFEAPIELSFGTPTRAGGTGLDGVTGLDTWTRLQYARDGRDPQLGAACPADTDETAPSAPPAPLLGPEPVLCPGHPSTKISVRGNLDPEIPIADTRWDPTQPEATSTLSASLLATDPSGAFVSVELFLIKRAVQSWDYHALLLGDTLGPELGAGRLVFNANGTLRRRDIRQALRLPRRDGTPGSPLTLDLGDPTSRGGTGAQGLTSFAAATALTSVEHDGSAPTISARCLEPSPVPAWRPDLQFWGPGAFLDEFYPLCTGAVSTRVFLYPVLSRFAPMATVPWQQTAEADPPDYWTSTQIFDTSLHEVPIEIRFRHVAEDSWEAHVLVTEAGELVERATAQLDLDADGVLAHVGGDRSVALRLPDGHRGPPLALDFGLPLDERGLHSGDQLARYQDANAGIYADGWGPDACDDR